MYGRTGIYLTCAEDPIPWYERAVRLVLIHAIFLIGCNGAPLFTTTCGLEFYGTTDDSGLGPQWNQQAVQEIEDVTVESFKQVTADPRFANACERLRGWDLSIYPGHWFDLSPGVTAAGATYCVGNQGVVVATRLKIQASALPHELAHVVQFCAPTVRGDGHAGWQEQGIQAAIERVNYAQGWSNGEGE
jgi:hypothetical protein